MRECTGAIIPGFPWPAPRCNDPSGSARRSRRHDASAGSRSTRHRATRGSGSTSSSRSRSEDFAALPSDAFVRGALRTYAQYLGVSADKVIGRLRPTMRPSPSAPPPPGGLGRVERAIAATRIRDNQRFLLVGAATVVVLLLLFGLVARDRGAPAPAAIPTTRPDVGGGDVDDRRRARGPSARSR